jgi:tRNA threonylcarbamoyladenosine biosynthesis protein TsaE
MSGEHQVVETGSEDETARVAASLAATLPPGAVVLLTGDLGAGKTAFVRGMAQGLGLDPDDVSSPTFTLVQEYRARGGGPPIYHVDLYRLQVAEVEDIGLEELWLGGGVVAIEWAEKLPRDIPGAVRVEIEDLGEDQRRIRIASPGTDTPPR